MKKRKIQKKKIKELIITALQCTFALLLWAVIFDIALIKAGIFVLY